MPRLPDSTSFGQRESLKSRGVVPIRLGGEAQAAQNEADAAGAASEQGKALVNFGQTLSGIHERFQAREDRLNLIQEKSSYLQKRLEVEGSFEGDTDFKTYPKRFSEEMQKAKQEALGKIKNPNMRREFEADTDLDIQKGIVAMASRAWDKEVDHGISKGSEILRQNREKYLQANTPELRDSILHSSQNTIRMMEKNGYLQEKKIDPKILAEETTQNYIATMISAKDPEPQLKILKQKDGPANLLPTDIRESLIDKAEAESIIAARNADWMAQKERETLFNGLDLVVREEGLSAVPPDAFLQLDEAQRDSLITKAKNLAEGKDIPTDWGVYYKLKTLASNPETRKSFERQDLTGFRDSLGTQEYKELIGLQGTIREGKSDPALDEFRTEKQIVDGLLAQIGFDPAPKEGTEDANEVEQFRRLVSERKQLLQSQTGKKATEAELTQIVDDLAVKGIVPGTGWIWEDKKRAFQLEKGERLVDGGHVVFETDITQLPKNDRIEIEEALNAKGRQVTDEAILNWYNRSLRVYGQ